MAYLRPGSPQRSHRRLISGCWSEVQLTAGISSAKVSLWSRWDACVIIVCEIVAVPVTVVVSVLKEDFTEAIFLRVDRHLIRHQMGGPFHEICESVGTKVQYQTTEIITTR